MVEIAATINSVVGSGIATVTSASGIYTVDVPAPTITSVTGSGSAVVTSSAGVFNVDVTGGGGVTSLNTFTGTVNIVSNDATVTIVNTGNDIDLSVAPPGATVTSLNSLAGVLTCISSDGSVDITSSGVDIDFKIIGIAPPAGVTSVNGEAGVLTIVGGTGITVNTAAGNIEIVNSKTPDVITLNLLEGDLTLGNADGFISINATTATNIDIDIVPARFPIVLTSTTLLQPSLTTSQTAIMTLTLVTSVSTKVFISGTIEMESASSTASRVIFQPQLNSVPIPFIGSSQSIQNISPATSTYQTYSFSGSFAVGAAGTYVIDLDAYASGVPNGTVLTARGAFTVITNLF
jgi:hypothetical protein